MKFRHSRLLLHLSLAILATACSSQLTKPTVEDSLTIFPPPPDTTRIQFLTTFSSAKDITGKTSGLKSYVMGKEKEEKEIVKPYGIAIHNGKIYICDTMLGGMEIIDLERKTFDYFQPQGYGLLKKPINCFVDPEGNLYVADAQRRQVIVFDQDLKYLANFGDASKIKPTDVQVAGDKIYVTDMNDHKINVYSKGDHKLVKSFPDAAETAEEFLHQPTNLFVSSNRVYVSDFGEFNVKVFTPEGEYVRSIGSYGKGLGQFVRPKGIAVDKNNNLFVVDAGFENVQIFDKFDRLLMFFGGEYKSPGDMWLPAKVVIDYDNLKYFEKYVYKGFQARHLIFVTNQYGPDKVNVYAYVGPEIGTGPEREMTTRKN